MLLTGLKKNRDFTKVYREGRSRANRMLVVYMLKKSGESVPVRVGISVSKKVGNSVVRHRIKRRLREICRLRTDMFPESCDLVIIARAPCASADYRALEHSLLHIMGKFQKDS